MANELFLHSLTTIEFKTDPLLYTFECPPYADGRYLLRVFSRMVEHPKFKPDNSGKTEKTQKDRKLGKYLRFEITFRGVTIRIKCGATKDQPGNAIIEEYGSYEDYEDINLAEFASYFDKFLQGSLTDIDYMNHKYWKLAVLQVFEIARRIPAEDYYRRIPIALGIAMGLEIAESSNGTIATDNYYDLFRYPADLAEKEKPNMKARYRHRENAYNDIKREYNEVVHGAKTDEEAAKPLTTEEKNGLLKRFGYIYTNYDGVEEMTSDFSKLETSYNDDGNDGNDNDGNDNDGNDNDGNDNDDNDIDGSDNDNDDSNDNDDCGN